LSLKNATLSELKQSTPFIAIYTILWGITGRYLYWKTFEINPFPFIGLSDALLLTAESLLICSIFALTMLILHFISINENEKTQKAKNWSDALKLRLILAIITYPVVFYFTHDSLWFYPASLVAFLPLITPITNINLIKDSFSSLAVRNAVAFFIVATPVISVTASYKEAQNIYTTTIKSVMIKRSNGICERGCTYIGKIGDYFAVKGINDKIIMIPSDEMKEFEIYREK
jgi:hypothetical protein